MATQKAKQIAEQYCTPITGPGTVKYLDSTINFMSAEIFDLICGQLPDVNSCTSKHPQIMKKLKELTRETPNRKIEYKSLINTFLNLTERYNYD